MRVCVCTVMVCARCRDSRGARLIKRSKPRLRRVITSPARGLAATFLEDQPPLDRSVTAMSHFCPEPVSSMIKNLKMVWLHLHFRPMDTVGCELALTVCLVVRTYFWILGNAATVHPLIMFYLSLFF